MRLEEVRVSTDERRQKEEGDALALLHNDHVDILAMFEGLRSLSASRSVSRTLSTACGLLVQHAQIEFELFYPALRGLSGFEDVLDAARIEHRTMNELISELVHASPRNGLRASRIEALAMYVAHHFREEEEKLFPRARSLGIDLMALGRQIVKRRAEIELEGQPAACKQAA
jgi:hypothetical protein